jgi:hypothetical protein
MTSLEEKSIAADLRTRGCAVCNNVTKVAWDFHAKWQYALGSNEKAQSSFADELGFCPLHTWQLHAMSSPVGESTGLVRLVKNISRLLGVIKREPSAASSVQKLTRTPENCRICRMLSETETAYIGRLSSFLSGVKTREIYERSQGVCLRHLACLLTITSGEIRQFLLTTASRRFEEMAQQMQSYAAKREALRRDLITADEEDAHLRALIHLAGAEDYCAP